MDGSVRKVSLIVYGFSLPAGDAGNNWSGSSRLVYAIGNQRQVSVGNDSMKGCF